MPGSSHPDTAARCASCGEPVTVPTSAAWPERCPHCGSSPFSTKSGAPLGSGMGGGEIQDLLAVPRPMPDHVAAPRRPPLLDGAIARNCTRWLGDHNCGKPAVRHVLWDEMMENGFVCQEHLAEIGSVWSYYAMHEVGADCAMPGSFFFEELNVCRCPDELVPATEEIEYATA